MNDPIEELMVARATISELKTKLEEQERDLPEGTYEIERGDHLLLLEMAGIVRGNMNAANTMRAVAMQAGAQYDEKLQEVYCNLGLEADDIADVNLVEGTISVRPTVDAPVGLDEIIEDDYRDDYGEDECPMCAEEAFELAQVAD